MFLRRSFREMMVVLKVRLSIILKKVFISMDFTLKELVGIEEKSVLKSLSQKNSSISSQFFMFQLSQLL